MTALAPVTLQNDQPITGNRRFPPSTNETKTDESVTKLAQANIGKISKEQVFPLLKFASYTILTEVPNDILETAICVYQAAFSVAPYNEHFGYEETKNILLEDLKNKGDLVLGVADRRAISLTGGHMIDDETYYIDELAVDPGSQGHGYGSATLNHLLKMIEARGTLRMEIRTSAAGENDRVLGMYQRRQFVAEPGLVTVSHFRQGGRIGLDERIYLSKPPLGEWERGMTLKHLGVVSSSGHMIAVVFDKLLDLHRNKLMSRITHAWRAANPGEAAIEQCCFVTKPINEEADARVEMFGGEFCEHATRAVAAIIAKELEQSPYEGQSIEVSGVGRPLAFKVVNTEVKKVKKVTLEMPLPSTKEIVEETGDVTILYDDRFALWGA